MQKQVLRVKTPAIRRRSDFPLILCMKLEIYLHWLLDTSACLTVLLPSNFLTKRQMTKQVKPFQPTGSVKKGIHVGTKYLTR